MADVDEPTSELQQEPVSSSTKTVEAQVVETEEANGEVATTEPQDEEDSKGQNETQHVVTDPPQQETVTANEQSKTDPPQEPTATDDKPTETHVPKPKPPQKKIPPISGSQLRRLIIGTELQKVKQGGKLYPRRYNISSNLIRLIWNSKRKSAAKAQIPLSHVHDVIKGRQTASFQGLVATVEEDKCFSIVFGDTVYTKILSLVAPTAELAELWVNGLQALIGMGVSENTSNVRKRWLRGLFDTADENGDGTLDLKEVIQMMKRLNVGISNKVIKRKFKQADASGSQDNKLDFDEFSQLFSDLSDRPEMRRLFNLYSTVGSGSYMSVKDLMSFLDGVQNVVGASEEYCKSVIERFEPSEEAKNNYQLSLDGFTQFMMSPDNDLFKRQHKQIYQDMNQSLSHYYVASSHNTYLEADQLSGPSSVDAYVRALKRGCRCVELDCWDGDDNEPIIYHGHTLTSRILFKDVIEGIKEHAFVASPYPLILSIENHCSVKQQHVMAEHMINIFGDLLYRVPRDADKGALPSPEELRNKILIKAKKLPIELEEKSDDEGEVSDEDEGAEVDPEEIKKARASSPQPETDTTSPPEAEQQQQQEVRKIIDSSDTAKRRSFKKKRATETAVKPKAKRKLSSKLSKCVNYIQSVHFKGFDEIKNIPFFHMSSFGESTAFKYSEEAAAQYVEYNKKHLSRTYPGGVRVDSSNYDPIYLWNAGCQIVALNYQTPGKPMDWNIGRFQQNGGCGYILKPDIMREDFTYFNHMDSTSVISSKVVNIRIISGQQLPKPDGGDERGEIIDPYVTVQFAGAPCDTAEYKTKVITDNGFNPVWNETIQQVVHFPELAMVRIKVMDYDMVTKDDFIGQFTLPLASMETGYRHVRLFNKEWEPLAAATLFVEVAINDLIGPPPKSKDRLRQFYLKKSRQYPSMRACSFPQLDSQLKTVGGSLKTAIDLREDFVFATLLLKDACGKPMQATVIECIVDMFKIAHESNSQLKLTVRTERNDFIVYTAQLESSAANASLTRMMNFYNRLNAQAMTLNNLSEMVISELGNIQTEAFRLKDELEVAIVNMPPRKAEQAKSNFSFNMCVLRNEVAKLKALVTTANDIFLKIPSLAEQFAIEIVQPSVETKPNNEPQECKAEEMKTTTEDATTENATEDNTAAVEDNTTTADNTADTTEPSTT